MDITLDVIEYKGYLVREDGAVFNKKTGHRLKHNIVINRSGRPYPKFHLCVNGVRELWFAHRLIAYLFHGPFDLEEFKRMIVDHLDNDSMNYAIWNLEVMKDCKENLNRRWSEFSKVPF